MGPKRIRFDSRPGNRCEQTNAYRLNRHESSIILWVNGVNSSELIDQEEGQFDLKGFLGLQLRSDEPMTVQFKDVLLKQL